MARTTIFAERRPVLARLDATVMDFEIVSPPLDVEIIAAGTGVRELPRLRRLYGPGRWRRMKGIARIRLRSGRARLAELHWYEAHEIYVVLSDSKAERAGDLRVIDESGEDYLFSADRFVAIEVPEAVQTSILEGW